MRDTTTNNDFYLVNKEKDWSNRSTTWAIRKDTPTGSFICGQVVLQNGFWAGSASATSIAECKRVFGWVCFE